MVSCNKAWPQCLGGSPWKVPPQKPCQQQIYGLIWLGIHIPVSTGAYLHNKITTGYNWSQLAKTPNCTERITPHTHFVTQRDNPLYCTCSLGLWVLRVLLQPLHKVLQCMKCLSYSNIGGEVYNTIQHDWCLCPLPTHTHQKFNTPT